LSEHGDVIKTQTISMSPPKFLSKLGPWPWQWSCMKIWNLLNTFCFIRYAYFLHLMCAWKHC